MIHAEGDGFAVSLTVPVKMLKRDSELFYLVAFSEQETIHLRLDRIRAINGFREPEALEDDEKIRALLPGTRCMNRWDEGSWDTIPADTEGSPS
ncbi:MAG: hypothetical protein LIO75_03135 [Lachnospiraceae bacterium]|nr:hypothetical protein [Lachnospiraceae bacterium]